jgi:hypothetical protein
MDPDNNDVLTTFNRRRQSLNASLDESRKAIDEWFERQPMPAPLPALAQLEVMLKMRRDLLAELVALDDEFMLQLIKLRAERSAGEDPR